MKKIIGIVVASMMFANIGYAEIRQIEVKNIKGNYVSTICVDGFKFVVYRIANSPKDDEGISMVQFMRKHRVAGHSYGIASPQEC